MNCFRRYLFSSFLLLLLMENSKAAPGTRSTFLEEASLQLGTLQAQAQYPSAAVQGARTASRSAASCLVTAVQYTHGQQIWRADPCEFCLCLDGEMFCWWQECPPTAPGPCPGPQPFSLCGNSSGSLEKRPTSSPKKIKKTTTKKASDQSTVKKTKKQSVKSNIKPLITVSQNTTLSMKTLQDKTNNTKLQQRGTLNKENTSRTIDKLSNNNNINNNIDETREQPYYGSMNMVFNFTNDVSKQDNVESSLSENVETSKKNTEDKNWLMDDRNNDETTKLNKIIKESKTGCILMGKEYHVGEMLPSTGSCLTCHCSKGNGDDSPAKVTCAPRGCAPPDLSPQDDTGAF